MLIFSRTVHIILILSRTVQYNTDFQRNCSYNTDFQQNCSYNTDSQQNCSYNTDSQRNCLSGGRLSSFRFLELFFSAFLQLRHDDGSCKISEAVIGCGSHVENSVERGHDTDDFDRKPKGLDQNQGLDDTGSRNAVSSHRQQRRGQDRLNQGAHAKLYTNRLRDEDDETCIKDRVSVSIDLRAQRDCER